MSKDKLNRYERAFRYVRDIAQQHCESYTQLCLRTDVLVEAIKKAVKYDEIQSILEEYNVTPEILREVLLTGQMFRNQPTLSECIKEWEDRGWKQIKSVLFNYGWIYFTKGEAEIVFYPNKKTYDCDCNSELEIDIDLHNLIGKTLKALEVEKNERNE